MTNNAPLSIREIDLTIKKEGANLFASQKDIQFIPSVLSPIKRYVFGSGAYAAVFKGTVNFEFKAIRIFLNPFETDIERLRKINNYLASIQMSQLVKTNFLMHEFKLNENKYPVQIMDWVTGDLLNKFVLNNLSDPIILNMLQIELVKLHRDLENNNIGHGDIQSGNILVNYQNNQISLKLIDYDGMFVPGLEGENALETGRTEFQHPQRTVKFFNAKIDRFSIWVILSALEILKFKPEFWNTSLNGGFNNGDNFLFTLGDFQNPASSKLFDKINSMNIASISFYTNKLRTFCSGKIDNIDMPVMFNDNNDLNHNIIKESTIDLSESTILITSNVDNTFALNGALQKIGNLPLTLNYSTYLNKTITISTGSKFKRITIDHYVKVIHVDFE